jgi:hypothetical protein
VENVGPRLALAIIITGTASSALAATKQNHHNVYVARSMDGNRRLGRDPDASKRFEVRRDGRSKGRSELIRTARPLRFARSGLGGSTTSMDVFYAGRAGRKGGLV